MKRYKCIQGVDGIEEGRTYRAIRAPYDTIRIYEGNTPVTRMTLESFREFFEPITKVHLKAGVKVNVTDRFGDVFGGTIRYNKRTKRLALSLDSEPSFMHRLSHVKEFHYPDSKC